MFTLPLLYGVWLSFFDRRGLFVGLANYFQVFSDDRFWNSIGFTVRYALIVTVTMTILSLLISVSINQITLGQGVVKSTMLIPWAISLTAWGLVGRIIFSQQFGVINWTLLRLGLIESRLPWLSSGGYARLAVYLSRILKDVWFGVLLFLVARQSIPREYYEEAIVSGANPLQTFRMITVPLLGNTAVYVGTILLIFALQEFDMVYALTAGGPGSATNTAAVSIYRHGVLFGNYEYGTALATVWSMFISVLVVLIFVPVQMKGVRR